MHVHAPEMYNPMAGGTVYLLLALAFLVAGAPPWFRHKQFPVIILNGCSTRPDVAVGTDGSLLIRRETSPSTHMKSFCTAHHLTTSDCNIVKALVVATLLSTSRADEANWILTLKRAGSGGAMEVQVNLTP